MLGTGILDERVVQCYTRQILAGLGCLHGSVPTIVHRDLKCDNILVADDFTLKLADFGSSKQLLRETEHMDTTNGTNAFMAPEIFTSGAYSSAVDIWGLGICVVEMLTGAPPLRNTHKTFPQFQAHYEKLQKQRCQSLPLPHLPVVTPECADFIALCLHMRPEARPTCAKLMTHSWMLSQN